MRDQARAKAARAAAGRWRWKRRAALEGPPPGRAGGRPARRQRRPQAHVSAPAPSAPAGPSADACSLSASWASPSPRFYCLTIGLRRPCGQRADHPPAQVHRGRRPNCQQYPEAARVAVEQEEEGGDHADDHGHDPCDSATSARRDCVAARSAHHDRALADSAPARLVEMSADVRAAVLLDPAGGLLAASDHGHRAGPPARRAGTRPAARRRRRGGRPTEQIEAQVEAVRSSRFAALATPSRAWCGGSRFRR